MTSSRRGLVALEGLQGLVGAGQDGGGVLEHVPAAADVERDDPHRLADRDDREAGLLGHPLGGAVPGAGLGGLDATGRARSWVAARRMRVPSRSRTIAPSILASSRSRVAENSTSSGKPPVQMRLDDLVVAEHDERAGAAAQDALEAVAQLGARARRRRGWRAAGRRRSVHGHRASVRMASPATGRAGRLRAVLPVAAMRRRWPDRCVRPSARGGSAGLESASGHGVGARRRPRRPACRRAVRAAAERPGGHDAPG